MSIINSECDIPTYHPSKYRATINKQPFRKRHPKIYYFRNQIINRFFAKIFHKK